MKVGFGVAGDIILRLLELPPRVGLDADSALAGGFGPRSLRRIAGVGPPSPELRAVRYWSVGRSRSRWG